MSLIIGPYYAGDPTIKPDCWGNFSDVQASLFHNAERMGLPIPLNHFNLWENAGGTVYNYGSNGGVGDVVGATWAKDGLQFGNTGHRVTFPTPDAVAPFSIEAIIEKSTFSVDDYFYSSGPILRMASFLLENNLLRFYIHGVANYTATTEVSAGKSHIVITFDGATSGSGSVSFFINGEFINTEVTSNIGTSLFDYIGCFGLLTYKSFNGNILKIAKYPGQLNITQVALLSDNPYALWQRVAPISYFFQSDVSSSNLPINDNVSMSDAISFSISKALSDSMSLSDNFIKLVSINKSDTISMSDNFNAIVSLILTLNDTINMSDGIIKEIELSKSDTISMSDSFSKVTAFIRTLTDTINLSDDILKEFDLSFNDSITMSDNFNSFIALILSLSDTISMSDDTTKEYDMTQSDAIAMTDNISIISEFFRTFSDNITMSDIITKTFGFTKDDIISMADFFSTSEVTIYALLNFISKNKTFNFNSGNTTFNFNAKSRG